MASYAIIVLIVISLSEIFKRLCIVPAKVIPLLNIILSICFLMAFTGFTIRKGLILGSFIGVFITGLYSLIKNMTECAKMFQTKE